jgi:hypothetical protein
MKNILMLTVLVVGLLTTLPVYADVQYGSAFFPTPAQANIIRSDRQIKACPLFHEHDLNGKTMNESAASISG